MIHMNGRVYDYNLGRFLSVDPFIQAPGNSQSMNPYSYIMNNPLAGTDPSGYAADIDQDKLEVKVTSQSRTRSAPTGSRIKRDTSRTITATVTDESGKSSNYVYTAARNGSESAFKITPIALKLDNTDLGSKGQVGVGTNGDSLSPSLPLDASNNSVSGSVPTHLSSEKGREKFVNEQVAILKQEGIIKGDHVVKYIDKFTVATLNDEGQITNTRSFVDRKDALTNIRSGESKDLDLRLISGETSRGGASFIYRSALENRIMKVKTILTDEEGFNYTARRDRLFATRENLRFTLVHEFQHAQGVTSEFLADDRAFKALGYPGY
ncbi:MAG: RHS repeat-associated core domain-containing protein [Enterobacterales bacterium]|nr:RHS repeat-associated core domain-containing protein [Enterobacterales bacterium]